MSAEKRRITLKDVAQAAGVSLMTASYALRNHPATAARTRERVRAAAEEIGYRPDPALSALMAYRKELRGGSYQGLLGVLIDQDPEPWESLPFGGRVMAGLRSRAARLGYEVEYFVLGKSGAPPKRLVSILRSRGVLGLVVMPPAVRGTSFELEWDNFCAVSIGRSLGWPLLDFVSANQYGSGQRIMRELAKRGYERMGFISPMQVDAAVGHRFLAAYFVGQQIMCGTPSLLPPLLGGADRGSVLRKWVSAHRPDVIISDEAESLNLLRRLGLCVPGEVGFAVTRLIGEDPVISGIVPRLELVGAKAVDFLHAKLITAETGLPEERTGSVIDGAWNEGTTVRMQAPSVSK